MPWSAGCVMPALSADVSRAQPAVKEAYERKMTAVARLLGHESAATTLNQLVESGAGGSGLEPCSSRRWSARLDAHLSPVPVDSVVTCVRPSPQTRSGLREAC